MTGGRASFIWLVLLGAGIGLFAGVWLVPHLHRVYQQTTALDTLEKEGERLAAQVEKLTEELKRTVTEPSTGADDSSKDLAMARARARQEQAKRLTEIRLLSETQEKLVEASITIDELKAKVADLEQSVEHLRSDNRQLAEKETELAGRLERANRVIDAMREELRGNTTRLVKMEARNRELRQEKGDAWKKVTEARNLFNELEDIYLRRENLLNGIERRYREVADDYRTASLQLANQSLSADNESLDLSRIQNLLSLTDDDLRQLQALHARSKQLQSKLGQKF